MESYKGKRSKLKTYPKRGSYDQETVFSILDAAFLCHLSIVRSGQPLIIPTGYCRDGNTIYLHGSKKNGILKAIAAGEPACMCVSILDDLVVARTVLNHSFNYRSVVLWGTGEEIPEGPEKIRILSQFTDNIIPGRSEEVPPISDRDSAATIVVALSIDEASAKVRTGGPKDEHLDGWGGTVPFEQGFKTAKPDHPMDNPVPNSIKRLYSND